MAKPQQDQTWPYRPPVNFYQQQVYNLPYQHTGICQDSCCQQPKVSRPYSHAYAPFAYPHQVNSFSRQTSQPVPQYVPVNPYIPQRSCTSHHRPALIHRPIPHNRYDFNDYYRLNNQRFLLNKPTNPNDHGRDNIPFSSNQYPACSHYTSQQSETNVPNIDVRQFLATWQDKDEDVEPAEENKSSYDVNFTPDPYQPLDCTKRNDNLAPNCDFNPGHGDGATFFNKNDVANVEVDANIPYQQQYNANAPSVMSGISDMSNTNSDQLLTGNCGTQTLNECRPEKKLNYIPYERNIEKICNPRIFKSLPLINNSHKHIPENQCLINENIFRNNIKEYRSNLERSQYHLSASLESDDLFDDINRKREEKQKNVVHPLRHDEQYNNVFLNNKKTDLPYIPVKPSLNLNLQLQDKSVPCNLPDKYSESSVNIEVKNNETEALSKTATPKKSVCEEPCIKKPLGKYTLEFQPKYNSSEYVNNSHDADSNSILNYEGTFNRISENRSPSADTTQQKKVCVNPISNQVFTDHDMSEKNVLDCSDTHKVASKLVSSCSVKDSALSDQMVIDEKEKKTIIEPEQELEISSDDIDISIASSGDLIVGEEETPVINNLQECLKLPGDILLKDDSIMFHKENMSNNLIDNPEPQVVNEILHQNENISDSVNNNNIDTSITSEVKKKISDPKLSLELNNNLLEMEVDHTNKSPDINVENTFPVNIKEEGDKSKDDNETGSQNGVATNALQHIAFSYQDVHLSEDSTDSLNTVTKISQLHKSTCLKSDLLCNPIKGSNAKHRTIKARHLKKQIVQKKIKFKYNAVLVWKLKNRLPCLFAGVKTNVAMSMKFKKYVKFHNKISNKKVRVNHKSLFAKDFPKSRTLDILTECSNNNCEVNCVIYQSDIDSYNGCEVNSIIAEEVHICSKCHQIESNDCSQEVHLAEQISPNDQGDINMGEYMLTENNTVEKLSGDFSSHEIGKTTGFVKKQSSYTVATDSNNKQLRELIDKFFSSGKTKIESEVTSSLEEPEIINEIIIKDAEEVGSNRWSLRSKIIKTVSQKRKSIKCSLAWDKIFSSIFEKNTIINDSLELGPAKIHLTLSPKNDRQGKLNAGGGEINIFKAIINAKKLILKRNVIVEERIPKMVIKKSEGQGYRSFIKDVCITSVNKPDKTPIIKFPTETFIKEDGVDESSLHLSPEICQVAVEKTSESETKQIHHCLLCQQSFYSLDELQKHESSKSHQHLDIIQRNALHKVYNSLYGCDYPNCQPLSDLDKEFLSWKPFYPGFNHNYYHALP